MSYPINYPTPQGANVQIFNANATTSATGNSFIWVKPQGASMVWFTLIGAGGGGGGTDGISIFGGGGSGAVTNVMIPAFLMPDNLKIRVGQGGAGGALGGNAGAAGGTTYIISPVDQTALITVGGGDGGTSGAGGAGGLASGATPFTITGFLQSVVGQTGSISNGSISSTTFLSGGGSNAYILGNYGYANGSGSAEGATGYFQMSPIMVGLGGTGNSNTGAGNGKFKGGIGCGGAGASASFGSPSPGSPGGDGLAVIITW